MKNILDVVEKARERFNKGQYECAEKLISSVLERVEKQNIKDLVDLLKNYNETKRRMCFLAGEIYSCRNTELSLAYFTKYQYLTSLVKYEDVQDSKVTLYSFRRVNEYSLNDLKNNMLTICSPKK